MRERLGIRVQKCRLKALHSECKAFSLIVRTVIAYLISYSQQLGSERPYTLSMVANEMGLLQAKVHADVSTRWHIADVIVA